MCVWAQRLHTEVWIGIYDADTNVLFVVVGRSSLAQFSGRTIFACDLSLIEVVGTGP